MPRVVFFDTECVNLPGTTKGNVEYSFEKPWQLGLAVAATTEKDDGSRQWLGADVAELEQYFRGADAVIGFNCLRFDFHLIGGEICSQADGAPSHFPAVHLQEQCGVALVDMFLDVQKSVGRVKGTGLKPLCIHTLGKEPGMEGALAPVAWADHRKLEVIQYCTDDVEWSRDLFNYGLREGTLKRAHDFGEGPPPIDFPITWHVRSADSEIVEPFREWYVRRAAEESANPQKEKEA